MVTRNLPQPGTGVNILAVRPLADQAITFDLAETIGPDAAARVQTAAAAIRQASLAGVSEVTASFVSVTVHYDALAVRQANLAKQLTALIEAQTAVAAETGRSWRLPCCYDAGFAPDLDVLSDRLGLAPAEIVGAHAETDFRVYALGFLPGLPFLGTLPSNLALPRRASPRTAVPAGSVAIANGLCVIYPWLSPGGWHILGRCPVPLFDAARPEPALLAPGDSVRFCAVSLPEFTAIAGQFASGRDPADFRAGAG